MSSHKTGSGLMMASEAVTHELAGLPLTFQDFRTMAKKMNNPLKGHSSPVSTLHTLMT